MKLYETYAQYEKLLLNFREEANAYEDHKSFEVQRKNILDSLVSSLDIKDQERLFAETEKFGPLESIVEDPSITEIMINSRNQIWIERDGALSLLHDQFLSESSMVRILERLCLEANCLPSLDSPAGNGKWRQFRVHALRAPLTSSPYIMTLRRHPENPWTLAKLASGGWCDSEEMTLLLKLIEQRKNFLVIGPTGSGKTSVVNSLLACIPPSQRCAIIEDTDEIRSPHESASFKLLTRERTHKGLEAIDQGELVRQSLRMRPDRIVLGEIRGSEAKDFLMALSTGHQGSFGTLHAESPQQALIRLEMLIQMGAPQWSLPAIRKLIRFGLDAIIVIGRGFQGERRLEGVHRIVSLEDSGFLLEQIKDLKPDRPDSLEDPEQSLQTSTNRNHERDPWVWTQRTS